LLFAEAEGGTLPAFDPAQPGGDLCGIEGLEGELRVNHDAPTFGELIRIVKLQSHGWGPEFQTAVQDLPFYRRQEIVLEFLPAVLEGQPVGILEIEIRARRQRFSPGPRRP